MGELFDPYAPLASPRAARPLDPGAVLALAREIGRLLSSYRPVEGYVPEAEVPEPPLPDKVSRALGAPTLSDYFELTLRSLGLPPGRSGTRIALPRGPESLEGALDAVREMIGGYGRRRGGSLGGT